MQYFLIIVSLILALVALLLLYQKKIKCGVVNKQSRVKEEKKKRILELLRGGKKLSNDDFRKELEVARRTATKYCEELEKEGKIKQVGKTGCAVFYKLK